LPAISAGLRPPRQPGGGKYPDRLRIRRYPPFSFHPDLALVADPLLFERFDEIAFNAGLLEKSVMDTQDYCASPVLSW
jgi:hypothetical protein